jgi:hypothetical protein
MEWCRNSPEQRAAIRACKAALSGDILAETARDGFAAFARKKDMVKDGEMPPEAAGSRSAHA